MKENLRNGTLIVACLKEALWVPWLYLTHAGTIFDIVPTSISIFGFVDEHTAITQFKPTLVEEEMAVIHELQESAITINDWMNSTKFKMNASRTEFIIYGSRQQLNKYTANDILVCGESIKLQNYIGYLVVFLDDSLDFNDHIKRKCQAAMLSYFKIKCMRYCLTKEATEVLCCH